MESLSPFRRRRCPRREEYTLLHNDVDGSQCSYSTNPSIKEDSSRNSALHNQLCDKCWLQHKRSKALKRCMDCKQNLCVACTDKEEKKRPWWLPSCLAQCMRFFFCYVYTPHVIVDLAEWIREQEHWALRAETSNVNRIPRISRDSLRNRHHKNRLSVTANRGFSDKKVSDSRERLLDSEAQLRSLQDRVARSKSFEDVPSGPRVHPRLPKRSISVEKLNKRLLRERRERDRIYNRNWDGDLWEQTRRGAGYRQTHAETKVKGKDVDIVISGSEMKLILNGDKSSTNGNKNGHKDGFFRRKSKTKNADKAYRPYTEDLFSKNPIWFKRDSSKKDKRGSNAKTDAKDLKAIPTHNEAGKYNVGFANLNPDEVTPYFVEEPPDQCPICLEELLGSETRVLSCSHLLHTICLVKYLRGMDNLDFGVRCPMCNRITEIRNYYAPKEMWLHEIPVSDEM